MSEHDFERGLQWAADVGPAVWNEIENNTRSQGYSSIRHYLECVTEFSAARIAGMIEGMGFCEDETD